ncbi:2-oxoadipate dioxygenase/decarboxylase HglS [Erwinia amylovora]|uniref:2-oxoadipate dioxygenase/decarboxylase HglS n=1 Tax=Erwinia amylovora TaxID=552 RepID=UPI001443CF80|nr:VOC family protein [Erwinia amylovora]
MSDGFISADHIRDRFSKAMSAMYQAEVPQYGTLLRLVRTVNEQVLQESAGQLAADHWQQEVDRLSVERHGAIRVGTARELATLRQLFAVMGMSPVGYYDLSAAGVPVHSTAFRPVTDRALQINPFRVFTSLLRLELIDDAALRQRAGEILAQRDIFTPRLRELLALWQQQGGLKEGEADDFVRQALETFRWHQQASVDLKTYHALLAQHRLIADVVCFRGPHINHLTPRTLDIDRVQQLMPENGITPKETIEGPPARRCPILLRQTSFKALSEAIDFTDRLQGMHSARFGEIEQRGVALTPKGRELYDRLLAEASKQKFADNASYQQHLRAVFVDFPDDAGELRREQLAWYRYRRNPLIAAAPGLDLESLIASGAVVAEPITYEDFLPVSAAGIFQSNLGGDSHHASSGHASQAAFEQALGATVADAFSLYQQCQQESLDRLQLDV